MRREVIISDLAAAVREKNRLCDFCTEDRWETVSYETSAVSGTMLNASETTIPGPLTIAPGLTGWYRIYVCPADFGGFGASRIYLKLTNDTFRRCISAGSMEYYCIWSRTENVEESFWKCADMTGQTVAIEKVDNRLPHTSNIMWFRFVPMEEAEVAAYFQYYVVPFRSHGGSGGCRIPKPGTLPLHAGALGRRFSRLRQRPNAAGLLHGD